MKELLRANVGIPCIIKNVFKLLIVSPWKKTITLVLSVFAFNLQVLQYSPNLFKIFVNHRGFQPVGQYRQHIKVQKALNKYSTYLLCSLKLFLNH